MDETHVDIEVRLDSSTAFRLQRIAEIADVSIAQVASVLFALWCAHNIPDSGAET